MANSNEIFPENLEVLNLVADTALKFEQLKRPDVAKAILDNFFPPMKGADRSGLTSEIKNAVDGFLRQAPPQDDGIDAKE